jgi:ribosomal protein S18 acetylase RimI-like enzyme
VSISLLTESKINAVIAIADEALGKGFLGSIELRNYIEAENRACYVSETNGSISGFLLTVVCKHHRLQKFALADSFWFRKRFSKLPMVGVVKTIAVSSVNRNQGIGTLLAKKSVEILQERTSNIISLCWEQQNGNPILHILEAHGMKQVRKIEGFWSEDSIINQYDCKACGSPPCKCNALIYQHFPW